VTDGEGQFLFVCGEDCAEEAWLRWMLAEADEDELGHVRPLAFAPPEPRQPGEVRVSGVLARELVLLRHRYAIETPVEMAVADLTRVEQALGASLPGSVLATLAAAGLGPDAVLEQTRTAWQDHGMQRRFIAFSMDNGNYWCVIRGARGDDERVAYWHHDLHWTVPVDDHPEWVTLDRLVATMELGTLRNRPPVRMSPPPDVDAAGASFRLVLTGP
jgi:hypothetical protein